MYNLEIGDNEAVVLEGIYNWALFSEQVEGVKYFEDAEKDMLFFILYQLTKEGYKPTLQRIVEALQAE